MAGIVHRDIKPSNLMIDHEQRVRVLDFGLARLITDQSPAISDDYMVGTLGYMAPEIVIGEKFDKRADIYSLGILAYVMLTGIRPPSGDGTTEAVSRAMEGKIKEELEDLKQFPPPVIAPIGRMIETDVNRRYPTMNAVCMEIERIRKDSLISG